MDSITTLGLCSPIEDAEQPKHSQASPKPLPSQERLRELLNYDPETGVFTNRISRGGRAQAGAVVGTIASCGGLQLMVDKRVYKAHRLAWMYHHGIDPGSLQIDHINGNRADNSIQNLRLTDPVGNQRNRRMSSVNKSGVTGVRWNERLSKWHARIAVDGKCRHLGYYTDFDEAVATRKQAELDYGYHPNHGLTAEQRATGGLS